MAETKEAILSRQMQAGSSYQLVKSPAVSGSQSYKGFVDIAYENEQMTVVPSIRVQLIHAMRLLPLQSATIPVQLEDNSFSGPILCN